MDEVETRVIELVHELAESEAFELAAPNSARALATSLIELIERQRALTNAELEEFLVDSRDLAEVFDLPEGTLAKLRAAVDGEDADEDKAPSGSPEEREEDVLAAKAVEHEPLANGVGAFLLEVARVAKEIADQPWDTVVLEPWDAAVHAYFQRTGEDVPGSDVGPRVALLLSEGDGSVDVQRNKDASVSVRALPFPANAMIELGNDFAMRILPPILSRAATQAAVRKALTQAARAHDFVMVLLSRDAESISEGEDLPIIVR